MANVPIKHVEKLADKNRKYFRLRQILPAEYVEHPFWPSFFLHCKWWRFIRSLDRYSLSTTVYCINDGDVTDKFNLRMGIFGESGENIVKSKAKPMTPRHFKINNFITKSKLNSLVQSNELFIFFVEIEKKDEEKAKVFKRKFATDYQELLLSGKKSDFTINVKHRKFNCHRLILGARSPVFSAMMEHEMTEKRSGEVFIPDADPAVFQSFLLYLYTGKKENLNLEKITELYKLGDKYCVDDLKYMCVEQMKDTISMENFFDFFLISQQHSDSELSDAAIEFFVDNSEHIIEQEMWNEFMKEYPKETYVLVKAL